jgi:uncharacterized membrane protein required for colicin V production
MTFDVLGDINYLAALVAALAYFAIGAAWYSPALFSKPWLKAIGREGEQPETPGAMLFIGTAIAYFIQAVVLAAIARTTGATELVDGLVLGIFVGVGVVATVTWVNTSYEQRPPALFWINALNGVLGFVAMAIIVTIWD